MKSCCTFEPKKKNKFDFGVFALCPCWRVPAENKSEILYRRATCSVSAGAFEDEDIIHVEGTVDPVRDMEIIHEELRLKDEEMIGPIIDKLEKTAIRGGDKKLKPEYVSQCPSRPFASPHSKAQIITLPHTHGCGGKKILFFLISSPAPTPRPIFPLLRLKVIRGQGFSAGEIINRELLIQLLNLGHSTGLMKVFPHSSFHLK